MVVSAQVILDLEHIELLVDFLFDGQSVAALLVKSLDLRKDVVLSLAEEFVLIHCVVQVKR